MHLVLFTMLWTYFKTKI